MSVNYRVKRHGRASWTVNDNAGTILGYFPSQKLAEDEKVRLYDELHAGQERAADNGRMRKAAANPVLDFLNAYTSQLTADERRALRAASRVGENLADQRQTAAESRDALGLVRAERTASRDQRDANEDVMAVLRSLAEDDERPAALRQAAARLVGQSSGAAKLQKDGDGGGAGAGTATVSTAEGLMPHDLEDDTLFSPEDLGLIQAAMLRDWSGVEIGDDEIEKVKLKDTARFERCVRHVKEQGDGYNPWAVCYAALGDGASAKIAAAPLRKTMPPPPPGAYFYFAKFESVAKDGAAADERIVIGIASSESIDGQDEIVDAGAIQKALADFMAWANLREMHENRAAGVVLKVEQLAGEVEIDGRKINNPLKIIARVIDDVAWHKVKQGVYKGFSIGGKVVNWVMEKVNGKEIRRITELILTEISLVDRPANPDARILVYKRADTPLRKLDADEDTGAMVALALPAEVAKTLAAALPAGLAGEAPDDLHMTLVFMGQAADLADKRETIEKVVAGVAAQHGPIKGKVSGVGVFNGDGDQRVLYASVDSPDLPALRQALHVALKAIGVDMPDNHGFTPHITLAYLPTPQALEALPDIADTALAFDSVTLAMGPERLEFPLGKLAGANGVRKVNWNSTAADRGGADVGAGVIRLLQQAAKHFNANKLEGRYNINLAADDPTPENVTSALYIISQNANDATLMRAARDQLRARGKAQPATMRKATEFKDGGALKFADLKTFYAFTDKYPFVNDPNFREVVQTLVNSDAASTTGQGDPVEMTLTRKGNKAEARFKGPDGKNVGVPITLSLFLQAGTDTIESEAGGEAEAAKVQKADDMPATVKQTPEEKQRRDAESWRRSHGGEASVFSLDDFMLLTDNSKSRSEKMALYDEVLIEERAIKQTYQGGKTAKSEMDDLIAQGFNSLKRSGSGWVFAHPDGSDVRLKRKVEADYAALALKRRGAAKADGAHMRKDRYKPRFTVRDRVRVPGGRLGTVVGGEMTDGRAGREVGVKVKLDPIDPNDPTEEAEFAVYTDDELKGWGRADRSAPATLVKAAERISTKDPATMGRAEINKELERLRQYNKAITREMIDAGRGEEKSQETFRLTDPLALRYQAVSNRERALLFEIEQRMGPGYHSLPTWGSGFGPRKKPGADSDVQAAAPATLRKLLADVAALRKAFTDADAQVVDGLLADVAALLESIRRVGGKLSRDVWDGPVGNALWDAQAELLRIQKEIRESVAYGLPDAERRELKNSARPATLVKGVSQYPVITDQMQDDEQAPPVVVQGVKFTASPMLQDGELVGAKWHVWNPALEMWDSRYSDIPRNPTLQQVNTAIARDIRRFVADITRRNLLADWQANARPINPPDDLPDYLSRSAPATLRKGPIGQFSDQVGSRITFDADRDVREFMGTSGLSRTMRFNEIFRAFQDGRGGGEKLRLMFTRMQGGAQVDLVDAAGTVRDTCQIIIKLAAAGLRKAYGGNFLDAPNANPTVTNLGLAKVPQFERGSRAGDKINAKLPGGFSVTYTLRSKTNRFGGAREMFYGWQALGEVSRSDDDYRDLHDLNQALANTHRILSDEAREAAAEEGKAAPAGMRKAVAPYAISEHLREFGDRLTPAQQKKLKQAGNNAVGLIAALREVAGQTSDPELARWSNITADEISDRITTLSGKLREELRAIPPEQIGQHGRSSRFVGERGARTRQDILLDIAREKYGADLEAVFDRRGQEAFIADIVDTEEFSAGQPKGSYDTYRPGKAMRAEMTKARGSGLPQFDRFVVEVLDREGGQVISTLTPEQFRQGAADYISGSGVSARTGFLEEIADKFNEAKRILKEPERVRVAMRSKSAPASMTKANVQMPKLKQVDPRRWEGNTKVGNQPYTFVILRFTERGVDRFTLTITNAQGQTAGMHANLKSFEEANRMVQRELTRLASRQNQQQAADAYGDEATAWATGLSRSARATSVEKKLRAESALSYLERIGVYIEDKGGGWYVVAIPNDPKNPKSSGSVSREVYYSDLADIANRLREQRGEKSARAGLRKAGVPGIAAHNRAEAELILAGAEVDLKDKKVNSLLDEVERITGQGQPAVLRIMGDRDVVQVRLATAEGVEMDITAKRVALFKPAIEDVSDGKPAKIKRPGEKVKLPKVAGTGKQMRASGLFKMATTALRKAMDPKQVAEVVADLQTLRNQLEQEKDLDGAFLLTQIIAVMTELAQKSGAQVAETAGEEKPAGGEVPDKDPEHEAKETPAEEAFEHASGREVQQGESGEEDEMPLEEALELVAKVDQAPNDAAFYDSVVPVFGEIERLAVARRVVAKHATKSAPLEWKEREWKGEKIYEGRLGTARYSISSYQGDKLMAGVRATPGGNPTLKVFPQSESALDDAKRWVEMILPSITNGPDAKHAIQKGSDFLGALDDSTVIHTVIRALAELLSGHGDAVAGKLVGVYGDPSASPDLDATAVETVASTDSQVQVPGQEAGEGEFEDDADFYLEGEGEEEVESLDEEGEEEAEEYEAAAGARMRKARTISQDEQERLAWFKANPKHLVGRFVNAGGLIGFVVGLGQVGKTKMTGLKIKNANGQVDVADLNDLKMVNRDDPADAKALRAEGQGDQVRTFERAAPVYFRKDSAGTRFIGRSLRKIDLIGLVRSAKAYEKLPDKTRKAMDRLMAADPLEDIPEGDLNAVLEFLNQLAQDGETDPDLAGAVTQLAGQITAFTQGEQPGEQAEDEVGGEMPADDMGGEELPEDEAGGEMPAEEVEQPAKAARARMRKNDLATSSEYDAALDVFRAAADEFAKVRAAYRARRIGDAEFLEARRKFDAAQAALDAAEAKEQSGGDVNLAARPRLRKSDAPPAFSAAELEAMPTLSQGQDADLKFDDGEWRVWLSRMTTEDGMPYDDAVEVEHLENGAWVQFDMYQGAAQANVRKAVDRFRRGPTRQSTYTCGECGKRTRDTGQGEASVGLCAACYASGELVNAHSDGAHDETPDPACPVCQEAAGKAARPRLRKDDGDNAPSNMIEIRVSNDNTWAAAPVATLRVDDETEANNVASEYAGKYQAKEARWNWKGSSQGHFIRPFDPLFAPKAARPHMRKGGDHQAEVESAIRRADRRARIAPKSLNDGRQMFEVSASSPATFRAVLNAAWKITGADVNYSPGSSQVWITFAAPDLNEAGDEQIYMAARPVVRKRVVGNDIYTANPEDAYAHMREFGGALYARYGDVPGGIEYAVIASGNQPAGEGWEDASLDPAWIESARPRGYQPAKATRPQFAKRRQQFATMPLGTQDEAGDDEMRLTYKAGGLEVVQVASGETFTLTKAQGADIAMRLTPAERASLVKGWPVVTSLDERVMATIRKSVARPEPEQPASGGGAELVKAVQQAVTPALTSVQDQMRQTLAALEEVRKEVTGKLEQVDERMQQLEDQPLPGGPVVRNFAPQNGLRAVDKALPGRMGRNGASTPDPEELTKLENEVADYRRQSTVEPNPVIRQGYIQKLNEAEARLKDMRLRLGIQ